MKILLIEDDIILNSTLTDLLNAEGYQVEVANDGLSGLKRYKTDRFDLVITDIILPGKDGMEIISEIRKQDKGTKIIAISGGCRYPSNDFLLMASIIGADIVLAKPFEIDEFLSSVKELVSLMAYH
jgi:DNA-binding response OmpR family regulator